MDQHVDAVALAETSLRNCVETQVEPSVEDVETVSVVSVSVTIVLMGSSLVTSASAWTGRVLETRMDRCAEDTGGASVARVSVTQAGHVGTRTRVVAAPTLTRVYLPTMGRSVLAMASVSVARARAELCLTPTNSTQVNIVNYIPVLESVR